MSAGVTREGKWAVFAIAAVGCGAIASGNGQLGLVFFLAGSLFVVGVLLGAWNIRKVRIWRQPPAELFAGIPATGTWWVENVGRWSAHALVVEELPSGEGRASVPLVRPGAVHKGFGTWTQGDRGTNALHRVGVTSDWPFGLIRWSAVFEQPVEVIVFPTPLPMTSTEGSTGDGAEFATDDAEIRLRRYVSGDRSSSIHWRTTARLDELMVNAPRAHKVDRVVIRIERETSDDLDRALGRGCSAILDAFDRGAAVGLDLDGERFEPRTGSEWRRALLTILAIHRTEPAALG